MAKRFPLDFSELKKGDIIPADLLERVTGVSRDSPKYAMKLMGIQQQVSDALEALGRPATVVIRLGEIKVLTDAEASTYNYERLGQHLQGAIRSHERSMAVDTANLSDVQKKQHTRQIEVSGKFIQAIIATGKRLNLPVYSRKTPGLLGTE